MNKAHYLSLAFILLSFTCANAMAEEYRFAWSLGVGNSQFQLNQPELIASYAALDSSSSFADSSTAFNIFGGMRLDEHLSLGLDLLLAGDIVARGGGRSIKLFDVSTFAVTVALTNPIGQRAQLFAQLGVHMWDISKSSDNFDTLNSAVDLTYGVGVDINLYGDRSRQLRIQWNHYEYDGIFIDSSDTLLLSILFLIGAE